MSWRSFRFERVFVVVLESSAADYVQRFMIVVHRINNVLQTPWETEVVYHHLYEMQYRKPVRLKNSMPSFLYRHFHLYITDKYELPGMEEGRQTTCSVFLPLFILIYFQELFPIFLRCRYKKRFQTGFLNSCTVPLASYTVGRSYLLYNIAWIVMIFHMFILKHPWVDQFWIVIANHFTPTSNRKINAASQDSFPYLNNACYVVDPLSIIGGHL